MDSEYPIGLTTELINLSTFNFTWAFKNWCTGQQLPNRIRGLFQTPVDLTIAANRHSIIEVKTVFLKSSPCLFSRGTQSITQIVKPQRRQASQIKLFEMQICTNNYAFMRPKGTLNKCTPLTDTLFSHAAPLFLNQLMHSSRQLRYQTHPKPHLLQTIFVELQQQQFQTNLCHLLARKLTPSAGSQT